MTMGDGWNWLWTVPSGTCGTGGIETSGSDTREFATQKDGS